MLTDADCFIFELAEEKCKGVLQLLRIHSQLGRNTKMPPQQEWGSSLATVEAILALSHAWLGLYTMGLCGGPGKPCPGEREEAPGDDHLSPDPVPQAGGTSAALLNCSAS